MNQDRILKPCFSAVSKKGICTSEGKAWLGLNLLTLKADVSCRRKKFDIDSNKQRKSDL